MADGSLMTAVLTTMILSPVGNSVTQSVFPVQSERYNECQSVARELLKHDVVMSDGKYSYTQKIKVEGKGGEGGITTTIIKTLECVLRPEGY